MPAPSAATRKGWLVSTPDNTGTDVTNIGHIFGRLGVGLANYPGSSAPFYWGKIEPTDEPTINVSVFPNAEGDAGLNGAAKFIEIEAKVFDWETLDGYVAPTQPVAASSPDSKATNILLCSAVASLSIIMSLY